jgi:hypothetical protein
MGQVRGAEVVCQLTRTRDAEAGHFTGDACRQAGPSVGCAMITVLRSTMLLVVLVLVASGCGDAGGDLDTSSGASTLPVLILFEQPIADAPDPADRAGAASDYVQCTSGLSNGGWSLDFGPPQTTSDAESALTAFLGEGLFSLPTDGYAAAGADTDRILFTYPVANTPKVAVIVVDSPGDDDLGLGSGWVVETFATCDPSEYDDSADDDILIQVWLDADGNRVPTSTISSLQGAEHCGWESVTYLSFMDQYYISDPRGVLSAPLVVPFSDDAVLPADAVDTGFRRDGAELWISKTATVAYLVRDDKVEAWPTPVDPNSIFCA